MLGISGDSAFSHKEYAACLAVPFPLLSDIHRAVIKRYGVLEAARNVAYRSSFAIDAEGILRWGQVGDRHMVRDGAELLRVLDVIAALPKG